MQFPALFEQRMRTLLGDAYDDFAAAFAADIPSRGLRVNPLKVTHVIPTANPGANSCFNLQQKDNTGVHTPRMKLANQCSNCLSYTHRSSAPHCNVN